MASAAVNENSFFMIRTLLARCCGASVAPV